MIINLVMIDWKQLRLNDYVIGVFFGRFEKWWIVSIVVSLPLSLCLSCIHSISLWINSFDSVQWDSKRLVHFCDSKTSGSISFPQCMSSFIFLVFFPQVFLFLLRILFLLDSSLQPLLIQLIPDSIETESNDISLEMEIEQRFSSSWKWSSSIISSTVSFTILPLTHLRLSLPLSLFLPEMSFSSLYPSHSLPPLP